MGERGSTAHGVGGRHPGYDAGLMETTRRWGRALHPLAGAAAALLAARTPVLVEALPVLSLLRGPFGLLLGAVAVGMTVARGGSWRATSGAGHVLPSWVLFAASFTAVAGLGLHYTSGLRVSGDEPHYLIMAQSLILERDLDLRDNYAREDWREYTPGPIAPHYGAPRSDGRPYPAHSPGLPVLLAPAYALGGRPAVVVLLAVMAGLLGLEVFRLAMASGASETGARWGWALALGPPVFFFGFQVYTELPSALALTFALRMLSGAPGPGAAAFAGAAASLLPWLHVKMVPAAAVLGLIALLRLRASARKAFVAVALAAAVAFCGYYAFVFGRPTPLALYGGVPRDLGGGTPGRATLGLLLDRSFGLLPHAPLYLLALASLPWLRRTPEGLWRFHAVLALAVVAPLLGWRMWWGGQSAPARFLVPLLPLLAVALALRLSEVPRGLARWRLALLVVGLGLAVFMTVRPGALLLVNRGDRPTRVWAALSGETPIARYLPSLVSNERTETRVALVWVVLLAVVFGLDVVARRRPTVDRWFGGLTLPLVLFLAGGAAVDVWARGRREPSASPTSSEVTTEGSSPYAYLTNLTDQRWERSVPSRGPAGQDGATLRRASCSIVDANDPGRG